MEEKSWKLETQTLSLTLMSKIESRIGIIKETDKRIFLFLSDFKNFQDLIPADRINNFESSGENCSFSVEGIGHIGLRIIEKDPNKLIKIVSDGKTPIDFQLWIQIKEAEQGDSRMKVIIEPKVNPMMMGMVKNPLKSFVDSLIDQAEKISYDPAV